MLHVKPETIEKTPNPNPDRSRGSVAFVFDDTHSPQTAASPSRALMPSLGDTNYEEDEVGSLPSDDYTVEIPADELPKADDRYNDGERGLSTAQLKAKLMLIESQMQLEEEEAAKEAAEQEERLLMAAALQSRPEAYTEDEFMEEERFRYAVPSTKRDSEYHIEPKVVDGIRARPEALPIDHRIPPPPSKQLSSLDQETGWGELQAALNLKRRGMASLRAGAEYDMEESLFAVPSSDDSDGYDEDFDELWRERTSDIFSVCRALETQPNNDEAATNFGKLLEEVADEELNVAEVQLLWNCIRLTYRLAEPIHQKHWLASVHEVTRTGGFGERPSVANFNYIVQRARDVKCLTERQRRKVTRWSDKSAFLVRKRLLVLQEFGEMEPTWKKLNVSVADLSREEKVPTMTIDDALTALTAKSQLTEASGAADAYKARSPSVVSSASDDMGASGLAIPPALMAYAPQ